MEVIMFSGSIVALPTPFKEDFTLDYDAYGRLINFQLRNGTDGFVPCGCTGEAATLSHEEQKACIRFVIERAEGKPVIAGAGSNNTREAIMLTKYAKEVSADAVLSITPYYNKPTAAGQIAHFTAIAKAADIPIMLYDVPGRTVTSLLPETIAELAKLDNIVALKDASGSLDHAAEVIQRCGWKFSVLSGDDSLTLPMMAIGARGVVSVAANIVPEKLVKLCNLIEAEKLAEARGIHCGLMPLFKALFLETNPMPVKAALARLGLIKNVLRLPLVPMLPDKEKLLFAVMDELGIKAI